MGIIYDRVSALCAEKNVTGYRVCRDIGIQPSIITDLKTGRKKGLNADTASKIAAYFHVSVDYLLGNEDPQKTPPAEAEGDDDMVILNRAAKKMTPEQRKKLIGMMRVMFEEEFGDDDQ